MKKGSVFIMSAIFAVTLGSLSSPAAENVSPTQFVYSANTDIKKAAGKRGATAASISAVVEKYFDYEEMSKRILGVNYNSIKESDRKLFCEIFTDFCRVELQPLLVERAQLPTKYVYVKGDGDRYASTTVTTKKGEISVVYTLYIAKPNEWRIIDVTTDGKSYYKTLKEQISMSIKKDGFDGMARRMKSYTNK